MSETRVVVDGLSFPEGPRWREGRLFFSDVHLGAVKAVTPNGDLSVIVNVPGMPSGLGWQPDGSMLIASVTDKSLVRLEEDGSLSVVADLSELATSWVNDMVVDGAGRAYIGNWGFDLGNEPPRPAELILVDVDGSARIVDDQVMFPNGTVITPDGSTLIVGETAAARLTAFTIAADGSLTDRRVWAAMPARAVPDGCCLDVGGCIWVASPTTSEVIRLAEGGEVKARVSTGDYQAFACMLGGDDRTTLFICTATSFDPAVTVKALAGRIEAVDVDVPGAGWP